MLFNIPILLWSTGKCEAPHTAVFAGGHGAWPRDSSAWLTQRDGAKRATAPLAHRPSMQRPCVFTSQTTGGMDARARFKAKMLEMQNYWQLVFLSSCLRQNALTYLDFHLRNPDTCFEILVLRSFISYIHTLYFLDLAENLQAHYKSTNMH